MSDIVERLRQPCSSNDANRQRAEAADEIGQLEAEIDRNMDHYLKCCQIVGELRVEIERLQSELGQVREILNDREAEIGRLRAVAAKAAAWFADEGNPAAAQYFLKALEGK